MAFLAMGLSLRSAALFALACLSLGGPIGCGASASGEESVDEGALIPAQLFSADCKVSIPADDGTVGTAKVLGRFRVASDGALSPADGAPVHFQLPSKQDQTVKLRSGRVIDAENDVFELTVAYGLFSVSVRYDGSKAKGNKQNVRIEAPVKGASIYDGTCTFKDEAGRVADGKVAPSL